MTRALLCCNSLHEVSGNFNQIWSLGKLTELGLSSRKIRSQNLFDVELPDLDAQLRQLIETGLQIESSTGEDSAWAETAFQHVHWRFVHYYQYRLRLETLIKNDGVTYLTLSSVQDCALMKACQAVCAKYNVELNVQSGPCDPFSSKLPFLATYDLPSGFTFLDSVLAHTLAIYYRLNKTQTFYQPYNNLGDGHHKAVPLTWRRSLCFMAQSLPNAELGHPRCIVNMNVTIRSNPGINFDPQVWPEFDRFDLAVLESAFGYFRERYNITSIDMLYKRLCKFLEQSRAHRLVLNSDNTCTTRLLAKAARTAGMQIDYLPHGVVFEDLSLDTGAGCGADRILAWNSASAAAYERRGRRAEVISHPSNTILPANKRSLPRKCSDLRILIMPPEWVGLSFSSRPDCFERDILDVLAALRRLDVRSAKIKLHNSIPTVLQAKIEMLDAIRPYAAIDFGLIDSNISPQKLYDQFDLIIIGPTTGLLEASRSTTPFIGFRALMHKAGVFSDTQFPSANTTDELVHCIMSYDVAAVDAQSQHIGETLRVGPHPFSMEIDIRESNMTSSAFIK